MCPVGMRWGLNAGLQQKEDILLMYSKIAISSQNQPNEMKNIMNLYGQSAMKQDCNELAEEQN